MRADSGHAPDRVVGRPTSSPRSLCALVPSISPRQVTSRGRERERKIEKKRPREIPYSRSKRGPQTQSSHSALPPPFLNAFLFPLSQTIPPLWPAIGGSSPRPAYAPATQSLCARCDGRLTVFAASFSLSLTLDPLYLFLRFFSRSV